MIGKSIAMALLVTNASASFSPSRQPSSARARIEVVGARDGKARVFFTGAGQMALVGESLRARTDTVVILLPARLEADVSASDLRFESLDGKRIEVRADMTGADASRLKASGKTVVLRKGGAAIWME